MKSRVFLVLSLVIATGACAAESSDAVVGDDADLTAGSKLTGLFNDYRSDLKDGDIQEVHLKVDKTFSLRVEGLYGCSGYKGYSCPSSWSDGHAGFTDIVGTWKSVKGGIKLQPDGPGTKAADPIQLTASITDDKLHLSGMRGTDPIQGNLAVKALYGKAHTTNAADLNGIWRVTNPVTDGDQPTLDNMNMYVGDMTHFVKFNSETGEYVEYRSDNLGAQNKPTGHYSIGGTTTGAGAGVIVLDDRSVISSPVITSANGYDVMLDLGQGRSLHLERE